MSKTAGKTRCPLLNAVLLHLLLVPALGLAPGAGAGPAGERQAAAARAGTAEVNLLHFNDFHAAYRPTRRTEEEGMPHVGGAAAVGGYIAKFRRERANPLVVFAGDMIQRTPLETATTAESLLEIFNLFAPDVATIGNHEFDYGRARLEEMLGKMKFPVVSANLRDKESGKPLAKGHHVAVTGDGTRVLFIGLYPESGKSYVEGDQNVTVGDAREAVDALAKRHDAEADLTVVVSHLGYDDDLKLAGKLGESSEVDLIIGGHSHTLVEEIDPSSPIPIVQAFCNGEVLGTVALEVDLPRKRILALRYELVPAYVAGVEPDARIAAIVASEVGRMPELFATIATTETPLGQASRQGETALGNFAVDALVDMYKADLAFMNSKSVRNSIPGPGICANDLKEAFPFEGGLFRVEIAGDQIIKMIEYYANEKKDRTLYLPHTMSCVTKAGGDGRVAVASALVHGKPLEPAKAYAAIVDDRTAKEFEKFYAAKIVGKVAENQAEAYIGYLREIKTCKPYPGGRMKRE